jgi:hypothetical protein
MPDVDPTPLTPLTLGDRLAWFRGDMVAGFNALSSQLATQHSELLAAINAIGDGVTLAQLLTAVQAGASGGATEATSAAILAAIGELSTYPAGWTVRALLAQLQTSIDSAPTGDPPTDGPPVNVDPYGCTYPYEYQYRCQLRQAGGTQTVYGVVYDVVYVQFQPIPGLLLRDANDIIAYYDPSNMSGLPLNCCLTWDFTGSTIAPTMRDNYAKLDLYYLLSQTQLDNPRTGPTGVNSFRLYPEPNIGYMSIFFGVKQGETPPNNVWFHAGVPPS